MAKEKPDQYEDLESIDVPMGNELIRVTRFKWGFSNDPAKTGIKVKAQRIYPSGKSGEIRKEWLPIQDDAEVLKGLSKAFASLSKVAGK